MSARCWIPRLAISLLCCGLGGCQRGGNGAAAEKPAPDAPLQPTSAPFFAGTASCSGRSCHGGLEPQPNQQIGQNEYTLWLTHDKHADAYRVLFNERSERIARNLGGAQKAHEDARCLSCHVTPYAGGAPADQALAETAFGVGCESCHGAAGKWLGAHTSQGWQGRTVAQKRDEFGFVPLTQLADLGQTCAGCHVGAPPNRHAPRTRDVNHDLIAAGHPRLNFELDVFLDNLPPHWNHEAKKKRDGNDAHVRAWAHGQLASAQAALELLAHRAEHHQAPWPEFAEYDCFACHHDLQGESWRQKPGHGAGRRLGSLPWGTWYFTMPRLLGGGWSPPDKSLRASLDVLEQSMSRAAPNRTEVAMQARTALDAVNKMRSAKVPWDGGQPGAQQIVQQWPAAFGRDERLNNDPSWDAAMQLYLAMYSLDHESGQTLRKLEADLAFPNHFDSPQSFSPAQTKELLKRLRANKAP